MFSTDFPKIHEYQISGKSVFWEPNFSTLMDGQTDRYDENNRGFSQFCERA